MGRLPPETIDQIAGILTSDPRGKCFRNDTDAQYACVSRALQKGIERYNFQTLYLDMEKMESLGAIMSDARLVYLKHLTIDLKFRADMPIIQSMDTARQQCATVSQSIQNLFDVLSNPVLVEKSIPLIFE